jgi:catechol 2,3-dioxygenase-like lactoylglutathione lyase family enzyme
MSVRTLRHTGIVVTDMERALAFYRDELGLSVTSDQHESGEFVETILAMPGASVRTVKLAAPEGPTLVELLEFRDGSPPETPGDLRRVGATHAALTVDDLDGLFERLRARGTPFLSDPRVSVDGRARVCFCTDPDGTPLELVEPLG